MDFNGGISGVFFVESLSQGKTGRWIHEHIRPVLLQKQLYSEATVRRADDLDGLLQHFSEIASVVKQHRLAPAIQIDAHGSAEGIQLTDGTIVAWRDLANPLRAINRASKNRTFLCSSMCHGGHLSHIALSQGGFNRSPYWGTIGPMATLSAGELQDAFKAFWEHMLVREDAPAAIREFQAAAGSTSFVQCEMLFGRIFMRYVLDAVLDPDGLDERVERVHRESGGLATKAWLRDRLASLSALEAHYREMHSRYLWIDEFPDQESNYMMTFADACRLFPQG